jgi:deoxyribonuclease-4
MVRFGPSGNDEKFYADGFKSTVQAPAYIAKMGLSALEIGFTRGANLSAETAKAIGVAARDKNILITAHAPYYINLCRVGKAVFEKNYEYIKRCLETLLIIDPITRPVRLVVHVGSVCDLTRATAIKNCAKNLRAVTERLERDGIRGYFLCIETMGRYSGIGDHHEICDLCNVSPNIIPTLDFGHINALEQGSIKNRPERITEIMDEVAKLIGDKIKIVHIHFSAVIYTKKGEHTHTTFDDDKWNFPFEPLGRYIRANALEPVIICESKGTQARDAVKLLDVFTNMG